MNSEKSSLGSLARNRLYPSRFQFDYIILSDLRASIAASARQIGGRILDYGCGHKPYAPLFSQATQYLGADFGANPGADVILDDSGELPPQILAFDAVTSFQVLEHVPNVDVYLKNCRRALNSQGGTLLLTTHGIWEYHPCPHDLYRWTHEGLAVTLQRSGFSTIAMEPVTTGIRSILQLVALRSERILGAAPIARCVIFMANTLADLWQDTRGGQGCLDALPICYSYLGRLET